MSRCTVPPAAAECADYGEVQPFGSFNKYYVVLYSNCALRCLSALSGFIVANVPYFNSKEKFISNQYYYVVVNNFGQNLDSPVQGLHTQLLYRPAAPASSPSPSSRIYLVTALSRAVIARVSGVTVRLSSVCPRAPARQKMIDIAMRCATSPMMRA